MTRLRAAFVATKRSLTRRWLILSMGFWSVIAGLAICRLEINVKAMFFSRSGESPELHGWLSLPTWLHCLLTPVLLMLAAYALAFCATLAGFAMRPLRDPAGDGTPSKPPTARSR
jgi:hypothetical protein